MLAHLPLYKSAMHVLVAFFRTDCRCWMVNVECGVCVFLCPAKATADDDDGDDDAVVVVTFVTVDLDVDVVVFSIQYMWWAINCSR